MTNTNNRSKQLASVKKIVGMEDTEGLPFAYLMLAKGGYPAYVERLERPSHVTVEATGTYDVPAITAEDVKQTLAFVQEASYAELLDCSQYDKYLMDSLSKKVTIPEVVAEWLGVNIKLNAEHLATMYINLMDDYCYLPEVNTLQVPEQTLTGLRKWMGELQGDELGEAMDDLLAIWNGCQVRVE